MPSRPLAYFLTWTCYGTWLHGDERGSVYYKEAGRDQPRVEPNEGRRRFERTIMSGRPVLLDDRSRLLVEGVIRDHAAHRGWKLLAVNVRTTHVHVVVQTGDRYSPEQALVEFKAWATRRLRESGSCGPDAPVWTKHGSTRWLKDPESINAAIHYVNEMQ